METRYKFGAIPKTALILVILGVLLALLSAIAVGQQPSLKLPPPLGRGEERPHRLRRRRRHLGRQPRRHRTQALTSGPELDTAPEWSQDGTRIAFFSQQ